MSKQPMEPEIGFFRKEREQTCWIEIAHDEHETPQVIEDLREAGWETEADRGFASVPPLDGEQVTRLQKRGTSLFGGWDAEEKKANMAEARKIMRKHGYTRIPMNTLGLADLL